MINGSTVTKAITMLLKSKLPLFKILASIFSKLMFFVIIFFTFTFFMLETSEALQILRLENFSNNSIFVNKLEVDNVIYVNNEKFLLPQADKENYHSNRPIFFGFNFRSYRPNTIKISIEEKGINKVLIYNVKSNFNEKCIWSLTYDGSLVKHSLCDSLDNVEIFT